MLSDYVDNYDKWRSYAYDICRCHEMKNDLVNDMYLKLHDMVEKEPERTFSDRYIYLMIRSIFVDIKRREMDTVEIYEGVLTDEPYDSLSDRKTIYGVLEEMTFFDREILLKSKEMSFREIGRKINSHHSTISKMYNESIEKAKTICREKGLLPKNR